jgi:REP element-mobilizing transposase RayT
MQDPKKEHKRRSIRIKGYDYAAPGAYFVTVVAQVRRSLFGEVVRGDMVCNALGLIVRDEWFKTAALRPYVQLNEDEFVVMPNHVHGIIWLIEDDHVGARRRCAPTEERYGKPVAGSIPTIVRAFKSAVSYRTRRELNSTKIWQRNYYEHILRNQADLENTTNYICANPSIWEDDDENPTVIRC